ncbi:hypothetical protein [Bradyrhizobium murdochi]|uniref:hypothetical protein n=1 Tax=Bradyrhizobium murdochi TaxID=1038859 RepID=UPI00040802E1|nr:hypothetical protein [Bradyrhizobium murdochi]
MESLLPAKERQANSRRWLIAGFLIYGTMIVGLLGFFVIFPNAANETETENARTATATKPVRYEGVIANWNRYRTKDARADAR